MLDLDGFDHAVLVARSILRACIMSIMMIALVTAVILWNVS